MLPLNANEFRHQLLVATTTAFVSVGERCAGERIYGFSLWLNALGSAVAAVAQSDEGLDASLPKEMKHWSSTGGTTVELIRKMKRWTCDDWIYLESMFAPANRLLYDSYASDPSEFVEAGTTRLVFLSCLGVLSELDARGMFGTGSRRAGIVLNLNVGDQSDEELCRWAIQVNPYEVYSGFASELEEAHAAFAQLTYVPSS